MSENSRARLWRWICLALLAVGFLSSSYLLHRKFLLLGSQTTDAYDFCTEMLGAGCDEALGAASSEFFSIPLAGWGIVFYSTVLSLLVLAWTLGSAFEREATAAAFWLAVVGAGASVALAAMLLAQTVPFCALCHVVHAVNLLLVLTLMRMSGRSLKELLATAWCGVRYLLGGKAESASTAAWKFVGFLVAGLVAVVAFQWVFVQTELHKRPAGAEGPDPLTVLKIYRSGIEHEMPVTDDDPRLGKRDAPAQLVIFTSFQCSGCRSLARSIPQLREHFGSQLSIVFKHFPLSTRCNSAITVDVHPQACEMAWAAESARRADTFWQFHDRLFEQGPNGAGGMEQLAVEIGMNREQFRSDWHDQATKNRIADDIDAGKKLGIRETPAIYLNGRRVWFFDPETLDLLIHSALGTAHE